MTVTAISIKIYILCTFTFILFLNPTSTLAVEDSAKTDKVPNSNWVFNLEPISENDWDIKRLNIYLKEQVLEVLLKK